MTGYIQANILGQQRGLKFGMLAVQQIITRANKLNVVLGDEVDIAIVPVVIYWGLFNNCYIKQEDPDFTFEDVCNWVDDNISDHKLFADIIKCFYESKIVSSAVEGEKKTKRKTGTS